MSMQPMFTIQSSASSSPTTGMLMVRGVRGFSRGTATTGTVAIHSGMCFGASFWKKCGPFQPSG